MPDEPVTVYLDTRRADDSFELLATTRIDPPRAFGPSGDLAKQYVTGLREVTGSFSMRMSDLPGGMLGAGELRWVELIMEVRIKMPWLWDRLWWLGYWIWKGLTGRERDPYPWRSGPTVVVPHAQLESVRVESGIVTANWRAERG